MIQNRNLLDRFLKDRIYRLDSILCFSWETHQTLTDASVKNKFSKMKTLKYNYMCIHMSYIDSKTLANCFLDQGPK